MHKILVVDDGRVVADTLVIIFKSAGYDPCAALYAEEAVELIAGWIPDLAILDVILPKMNGIDLAVLLRAKYPNCRVVLFSGHPAADKFLAAAAISGHAFEVKAKPAHPQQLLALAAQLGSQTTHVELSHANLRHACEATRVTDLSFVDLS